MSSNAEHSSIDKANTPIVSTYVMRNRGPAAASFAGTALVMHKPVAKNVSFTTLLKFAKAKVRDPSWVTLENLILTKVTKLHFPCGAQARITRVTFDQSKSFPMGAARSIEVHLMFDRDEDLSEDLNTERARSRIYSGNLVTKTAVQWKM